MGFLFGKYDDIKQANAVSSFIESRKKNNTPLSNKEVIDYLEYLKKSNGSNKDVEEFDEMLTKNLINTNVILDKDVDHVSLLSQIVSLPESIFLETLLRHTPTINDTAFLVYNLSTFYKEDQTETIKKAKLLLEHGFDPSKKDYVYKNEEPKSAVDILEKKRGSREELVEDGEANKIKFAQEQGKDPSQLPDSPNLSQFKIELENINRLIHVFETYGQSK